MSEKLLLVCFAMSLTLHLVAAVLWASSGHRATAIANAVAAGLWAVNIVCRLMWF